MDKLLTKLDLSTRLLERSSTPYLADYIHEQELALRRIYEGKPYVLCTYYVPPEFTCLWDVEFIYIERIVGLCVGCKQLELPLSALGGACSYQRAFLSLIQRDILPQPQRIIAMHYPCYDAITLCRRLSKDYSIPIDYITPEFMKRDLFYLQSRYSQLFQPLQDTFQTAVLSNKAWTLKCEIDSLRIQYPRIMSSDEALKVFTVENDFGREIAVKVLKGMLDCLHKRKLSYRMDTHPRLFWMGLIPLYNNSILSRIENYTGCRFVFEEMWMFDSLPIDSDVFFESLAAKLQNNLFYNTDIRIDRILDRLQQTGAQAIINLSHKRCSFLPPKLEQVRAAMDKHCVPFLSLETDVITGGIDEAAFFSFVEKYIRGLRNDKYY